MISIFVHRDGQTEAVSELNVEWLRPDSGATVWLDLAAPTPAEGAILRDSFHFHDLAVEDALSPSESPKIESYVGYLYIILHGIDFEASQQEVVTHDIDFFLGRNFLVTVHDGRSRSVASMHEICAHNAHILGEGPAALMHRIVDAMVDHYRPEIDRLEERIDDIEDAIFDSPSPDDVRRILQMKHEVASLRRLMGPQRDVMARLARREFSLIEAEIAYRFRDVHDHLVQLADQTLLFHDRMTGILEAHVSNVSNRLNEVMKVLTMIATIFMPLTLLTGIYGMNVAFPQLPGGEGAQFYWVIGAMVVAAAGMLWWFRRRGWL